MCCCQGCDGYFGNLMTNYSISNVISNVTISMTLSNVTYYIG